MTSNELINKIKQLSWNNKLDYDATGKPWYSIHQIMAQFEKPFDEQAVAQKCAEKATPGSKYWGMTVDEIIASWRNKSADAANRGVGLDTYIQCVLHNTEVPEIDDPKLLNKCKQFEKFKKNVLDTNNLTLIGTEIWVNSKRFGIRGKIDALFKDENDRIIIFDWKNNDEFRVSQYETMLGPLSYLPKSDIAKFSIQVYGYKYFLDKEFGLDIRGTRVVQFIEDDYVIHRCAFGYSSSKMEELFNYAIEKLSNK